ncbi:hypothetical protein ES703_112410 [subsurface metagenome]
MQRVEDKILGIYGSLKAFSQATGLSVPKICQAITGQEVLSQDDQDRFDNALNIETGQPRGRNTLRPDRERLT